jgi:protein SCO1/2
VIALGRKVRSRLAAAGLGLLLGSAPMAQAEQDNVIGGPLDLIDHHGKSVTERDFAGRYLLVFFGYTYCPDVCPMSLANMAAALDLLPEDKAEQLVPIFITLDPERDTVEQLAAYAPLFHPRLVGLTGTRRAVDDAARAYRVLFRKAGGSGGDYLIDHSTFIYLIGPDGAYLDHFGGDASAEKLAEDLEKAIGS